MDEVKPSDLRALKNMLGMTTQEMAKALSVSPGSVGNYLSGRGKPRRKEVLDRIHRLMDRATAKSTQLPLEPAPVEPDIYEAVPEYAKPHVMKAVRVALGFSQGNFCERNSFNQGSYSSWETGKGRVPRHHYPTLERAYRAAEKLGFNQAQLKPTPPGSHVTLGGNGVTSPDPRQTPLPLTNASSESTGLARVSDIHGGVSAEALLEMNTEFIEKFKEARQRQIIDSAIAYAVQKAQETQDFSPMFLRKTLGLILFTGIQESIDSRTLYRYVTGLMPP